MAFAARTSSQTGFPASAAGSLALGLAGTTPFGSGADPATWPKILDYLADPRKYMTVDQRAKYDADVAASNVDPVPYTGSIDPDTLGAGDWVFYTDHNLSGKRHEIFTKRPRMFVDKAGSRDMTQGDFATVGSVDSWYIPGGGALAGFI